MRDTGVEPVEHSGTAIVYSSFMTENRRESMTPVGIVGTPKTVAPQRLAITNENHRKRPAVKAGVAGSNPAGGTDEMPGRRPFLGIGLKGRGYLMATSITSGQCRRRRSAGRPRPRQAQRQRPVPGPQIQRCATFALGAVDTKALTGPREIGPGRTRVVHRWVQLAA